MITLREPVERAYSHYWNHVREGFEQRTFLQAIEDELESGNGAWAVSSVYVDCGFYSDRVETYLRTFGENVRVYQSDVERLSDVLGRRLPWGAA